MAMAVARVDGVERGETITMIPGDGVGVLY